MQEFNLSLSKSLTQGLRRTQHSIRNGDFLTACTNVQVTPYGLMQDEAVVNPFSITHSVNWPFPQLLKGKELVLLAGANVINEVSSDWIGQLITTYDYADLTKFKNITLGGSWHFADFGIFWMLFNGQCVVFSDNWHGVFGEKNRALVCSNKTINTGTDYNGRLLLGGFNPSDFWSDDWQSVMDHWTQEAGYDLSFALSMRENFVWWSSIGGGDALNIFYPERAITGLLTEDERTFDNPMFLEMFKRNEFGFMPMPWKGTVLCMKELGRGVMVYGDEGIAYLYPVAGPVPTFGMQRIQSFGISSRSAVGGDFKRHVFQDFSGALWTVTSDLTMEKLDYKEYLAPYLGTEVIISYNSLENKYYIGGQQDDEEVGYLLTADGLSQVPQTVTSGVVADGAFVGIFKQAINEEVYFITDIIDMGVRENKTIGILELGLDTNSDAIKGYVEVCAYYRYGKSDVFEQSPWVVVNEKGWARIQLQATEFKICVKVGSYEDFSVTSMDIRWQLSNMQTVRGFSAAQINR